MKFRIPITAILLVGLSACSTLRDKPWERLGVKPWERGILAEDEMLFGSAAVDDTIDDHMYFSKEASSGGRGFGGGGCGCN